MSVRAPALVALGVALACGLVAAVIALARARSDLPARCAAGMIALDSRCCGEGQRILNGRCAGRPARCADGMSIADEGCIAVPRRAHIDAALLRVGPGDWEAQGSVQPSVEAVAAFDIDVYEVTEARYAECEVGGACVPLPKSGEPGRAIAGISLEEATKFCAWAGGSLPTSSELALAIAGPKSRRYAWGDTGAVCRRAAWGLIDGPCAAGATGPELAGSHPDGASPEGVHDLSGNVAEWTMPLDVGATFVDVRGGSWADGAASALRSWNRRAVDKNARSPEIGLRCVYRRAQ